LGPVKSTSALYEAFFDYVAGDLIIIHSDVSKNSTRSIVVCQWPPSCIVIGGNSDGLLIDSDSLLTNSSR